MLNDLIIGLVETILEEYNQENSTKIKQDNLNMEEIKAKIINVTWEQIKQADC